MAPTNDSTAPPTPTPPPAPSLADLYGPQGNLVAAPPTTPAGISQHQGAGGSWDEGSVPDESQRTQLENTGALPKARTTTQAASADIKKTGAVVQKVIDTPVLKSVASRIPGYDDEMSAAHESAAWLKAHGHEKAANALSAYLGAESGADEFASAMTSPKNMMMLYSLGKLKTAGAGGEVLDRLISAKFSYDSIKDAYDSVPGVQKAIDGGDYETAARLITNAAGGFALGVSAAHGAVSGVNGGEAPEADTIRQRAADAQKLAAAGRVDLTDLGDKPVETPAPEAGKVDLRSVSGTKVGDSRRGPTTFGRVPGGKFSAAADAAFAQDRAEAAKPTSTEEKLPEGDYVYHATDVSRADSVRQNGLRPKSWYANSPEEAMKSGAVPISGNRADLRVFAVPKAEIEPVAPDAADMGAREVEKGRFTMSAKGHQPIEVTQDGRPLSPLPVSLESVGGKSVDIGNSEASNGSDENGEGKPFTTGEPGAANELPVPANYEKNFENGFTWPNVRAHEAGHAITADSVGFGVDAMYSHLDPNGSAGGLASQQVNYAGGDNPIQGAKEIPGSGGKYSLPLDSVRARLGDMLTVLVGGGVAQEHIGGIPFDSNPGLVGDMQFAKHLMNALDIPEGQQSELLQSARDRAKTILTHPAADGIIQKYTQTRAEGTPDTLHMTADRVNDMVREHREARNGENGVSTQDNTAGHGEAVNRVGEKPAAGGEGKSTRGSNQSTQGRLFTTREITSRADQIHDAIHKQFEGTMSRMSDNAEDGDIGFLFRNGDYAHLGNQFTDAVTHDIASDAVDKVFPEETKTGSELLSESSVARVHMGEDGEVNVYVTPGQSLTPEQISELAKETRKIGSPRVIVEENGSGGKSVDVANPTPATLAAKLQETFGKKVTTQGRLPTTREVNPEDEGDESFNFGANEKSPTADIPESKGTATNEAAESAQRYNTAKGQPQINHEAPPLNEGRAQALAAEMDTHAHEPNTPAVKKAYKSLIADVKEQWNHAQKDMGIKFEPSEKDPYTSYDEVKKDVEDNKHMSIYTGGNPLPEDHPLAQVDPKTGLTYNTMLRGVHDLYGHIAGNNDFSEQGESGATNAHRQMMSPESVPALLNETEGQVSQYFHGKDKGNFPPQNATTVPEHFVQDWHETAGKRAATEEAGGINPRTGTSAKDGIGSEILTESRKPLDHAPTAQDFKDFYEANKQVLDENPDLSVGWDNNSKAPGGHEINIGIVGKGAERLAAKLDQTSAFDIGKGEVLPTKTGTGLRTEFPNYPTADRIKDAKGENQSNIAGFEKTPQWIYDRMNDDVRAYVKDDPKLQQRIVDAVHNEPLSVDEAVSAASASAKLNGWWRRFNDIFDRIGDAGETKTLKSGVKVSDFLKAMHSALSGNKLVEDANNISFGSFYDWMKEGQPTDRKSIDNIIRNNGKATEGKLGPTGQPKRGNAALSDTIKNGKVTHENLDTTEFYRLVNSPEGQGKKPFGGNIYSETSPIEAIGAEARKLPSMAAVTAGGNLTNAVVDAIMGRFMGRQKPNIMPATEAKYIADTVFLRGAGDKLGIPTSEAQEQIWGTTQAFLTHLKNGLTPEAAADKIMKEGTYHAGKDYADVILNDPEVSGKGGYLDKLKSEFGIGPGSEGIADIHGQTRSAEPPKESAAGRIDKSHLEATGKRILGSLRDKTQARLTAKAANAPTEAPPPPPKKEIPAEDPRLAELRAADKAARDKRNAAMKKGISGLSSPA